MTPAIFVIIPYFQRNAGILAKALDSISEQTVAAPVQVIVVDDTSPVPPEGEVVASRLDASHVTLIRQANAGPGAARNRGLDAVPHGTGFVAFLDSDDAWLPGHLQNALDALGDELDFYIANYREPDSDRDEFTAQGKLKPSEHSLLPRGQQCYRFDGDMVNQVIVGNVIETSTVVFRHARLGHLRFRSDFRNAFEDHLFWIGAAQASRGFAFSMNIECQYGRGVSIWRATGLGSERLMSLLIDQRRYYAEIDRLHARTPAQKAVVSTKVREVRRSVIAEQLHRLRRRMNLNWGALMRYVRLDPAMCVLAWPIVLRIASGRRGS
jgi:succinoglycan biosynthesis protein ExoW